VKNRSLTNVCLDGLYVCEYLYFLFFIRWYVYIYIYYRLLSRCVGMCESVRLGNAQGFLSLMVVVRLPGLLPAVTSLVREEVLTGAWGLQSRSALGPP